VANLGQRIRQAREQAQISQVELARRIGISANALCSIETGDTDPRISRVVAIARELQTSLDALVGIEPPAQRSRRRKAAPVA
jgi:transcriptional regulator with XRE-family HTH domain